MAIFPFLISKSNRCNLLPVSGEGVGLHFDEGPTY